MLTIDCMSFKYVVFIGFHCFHAIDTRPENNICFGKLKKIVKSGRTHFFVVTFLPLTNRVDVEDVRMPPGPPRPMPDVLKVWTLVKPPMGAIPWASMLSNSDPPPPRAWWWWWWWWPNPIIGPPENQSLNNGNRLQMDFPTEKVKWRHPETPSKRPESGKGCG